MDKKLHVVLILLAFCFPRVVMSEDSVTSRLTLRGAWLWGNSITDASATDRLLD